MFLFDTDTISGLMRPAPSAPLIRRLASVPPERQFTSAITVGEVVYGAHKSGRPDQVLRRFDESAARGVNVLPFDQGAALVYGHLRVQLERGGISLSDPDLRIAAVALANDLTLITGNTRHFARVPGLRIENWLVE